MGSDPHRTPETWCSRTGTRQVQTAEARCSRARTLQAQISYTASDGLTPSAFDSSLEYSTDKVVLFWQPPCYFSWWSPSSIVVDSVSYSSGAV